ncbi:UNVERIFIED_CONTAM: Transposon Tf2-12 polyprotein [Sesamum radiatum]|uniref:Transposon Tf2-12 polyprotein n=1 Tax=Sesamum radiatum TaxID=300843 RepID=A0AAW2TY08_SESRA
MKKLGITSEDLSRSRLTIQSFDQGTQRAVGMTRLDLIVGELKASTLFHVIDARTSYNLLLGRPWLHENGVVPSTLHQCFKYIKNGEIVKVDADMKPFTEAESYFADAKLYLDPDNMQEVLPSRFPVAYPSEKVYPKATPIENNNEKFSEMAKDDAPANGKHEVKKPPYFTVFRYVIRSNDKGKKNHLKDHAPLPFKERKQLKEVKVKDLHAIKAELVTPITDLHPLISSDSPILEDQYRNMHGAFSQKAYHLLAKSGYDFSAPSRLNKLNPELIGEKIHGLTKALHKLRKQDKGKSDENQNPNENRVSVFKRLGNPTARASIFERLGGASEDASSNTRQRQRGSVFDRLGKGHAQQLRKKGRYDETNEHIKNDISEILHLSRPQGNKTSLLIVSLGGPIKVKQHVVGKPLDSSEIFNEEEIEIIVGSNHVSIDEGSDSDVSEDEIQNASPELEDGVQATVDELKELNLGTIEEPRPIFVSALLSPEEEEQYFKTLGGYRDVFAWTYKEMPGLDPKVAIHHLGIRHGTRLVKEVKYPTWISSIVSVKKKNGQIRICVDFRDLNKACPKIDFPLPIIELMVDATTRHEALSFMDGSSGYNQIRISSKDEECTAFRTPKGIYCYKVMPFGLKNAGATYQRAMQNIFDDMS